jgi:hypothetical protein
MQLQKASRKKAKIKLGLQGPSGSGKTYSALLIGYGLAGDWSKIGVIDTENHSADLYAHLGNYNTLPLGAPFSPERYIEALHLCITAGMEVIIVDSISHEWEGSGGILDIHGHMAGNSFTNWAKLTPRHNSLVQEILQSPVHVMTTVRSKQDYILAEKNGKHVPEKVGLKGVSREGFDYEMTILLELDIKHNAVATKDRTSLFSDKPEFRINSETGRKILDWCNSGLEEVNAIEDRINDCKSMKELLQLYQATPQFQDQYKLAFAQKRDALQANPAVNNSSENLKTTGNGTTRNSK